MSMANCDKCSSTIDTDHDMERIDGEMVCDSCYDNIKIERYDDISGYFSESLVEHDDKVMKELAELIQSHDSLAVGNFVINMVEKYVTNNKYN